MVLLLLFAAVFSVQAEESRWDVSLAFIGPADAIYSWWGHVAIIVRDRISGSARYYDYGNFSFSEDTFINNFVMGRLYFLKNVSNPTPQLRYSVFLNRDITIYQLNIPDDKKLEMISFLENDVKPENRIYLYDHFYDNCSTRIRDVLDTATGGELAAAGAEDSGKTLRQQLRRFSYSNPAVDLILNFAMKGKVDQPATVWESMFLPKELEKAVSTLIIEDEDGTLVPFAATKKIYNTAENRPAIPDMPPAEFPIGLAAGVILAAAGFLLLRKEDRTAARRGFAALSALLSLIFGLAGSLLFFMACFTDHSFTYWNQNLLFTNPFLLVTFFFSIKLLISGKKGMTTVKRCWTITAAGALLSVVLKLIPFCRQNNWTIVLFILLPAVVYSGLLRKTRTPAALN